MPRAIILGGSGAIGRATALTLLANGWDVDMTARNPERFDATVTSHGGRYLRAERHDVRELARVAGDGADLIVDCLCYTRADAEQLVTIATDADSTVMISAKAVYVDAAGRHVNSPGGATFDGPIRESQPTLSPSDDEPNSAEGYGRHKIAAEWALRESDLPISILRPSKVHGVGARPPREWYFVKRVLDGRPLVLGNAGTDVESQSAATNIAALIAVLAAKPGSRVLNIADPDAPSVREIAMTVAEHLSRDWPGVHLLPRDANVGPIPWHSRTPTVLDTTAARDLGYQPVGSYAETVKEEILWLRDVADLRSSTGLPTQLEDGYFEEMFDYAREDAALARVGT